MLRRCRQCGFTLAELLIALGILGVIATFTIPKILVAQQDSKYNAIAKESIGMVSEAWQTYRLRNTTSGANSLGDLTPYLNYVSASTSAADTIDQYYGGTATLACNAVDTLCLKLHNGAIMALSTRSFDTSGMTDPFGNKCVSFFLDPDGKVTDGTANGPGKSIVFILSTNGRVTTVFNGLLDPPWFRWSQ